MDGLVVHWDQLVQAIGTAVTIAGLIVVAPVQAGRVTRRTRDVIRDWWLYSVLRRPREPTTGVLNGDLPRPTSNITGEVAYPPWEVTSDNIDRQLTDLRAAVDHLRRDQMNARKDLARRLDEVEDYIRLVESGHAELSARVEETEQEDTEFNARGFPLAAMGTLIAGIAFWLAAWWFIPLHVLALGWAARALNHSRKAIKRGWTDAGGPTGSSAGALPQGGDPRDRATATPPA